METRLKGGHDDKSGSGGKGKIKQKSELRTKREKVKKLKTKKLKTKDNRSKG